MSIRTSRCRRPDYHRSPGEARIWAQEELCRHCVKHVEEQLAQGKVGDPTDRTALLEQLHRVLAVLGYRCAPKL
jgi:hypothetical protein